MYRYNSAKHDIQSLHNFATDGYKTARVEAAPAPKAPLYVSFSKIVSKLTCISFYSLFYSPQIPFDNNFIALNVIITYIYFYFSEDLLLGILEFFRECPFILKIASTIIGVFVVVSVAYRMNSKKEKKKVVSTKKSKNK